jgi:uncharacterized protein (DUF305 family)
MKYSNLFIMSVVSFISMYALMYTMVDSFANMYSNVNQLYMALLMTMPMVLIELVLMESMYPDKKKNALIALGCVSVFCLSFIFIRKQTAVDDKQFLKSMIPHHAAALLMCKETHLQDPELQNLCRTISKTQQAEIDFMKTKLASLK